MCSIRGVAILKLYCNTCDMGNGKGRYRSPRFSVLHKRKVVRQLRRLLNIRVRYLWPIRTEGTQKRKQIISNKDGCFLLPTLQ